MSPDKDMLRIRFFEENGGKSMDDVVVEKLDNRVYELKDTESRYYKLVPVQNDPARGFSIEACEEPGKE